LQLNVESFTGQPGERATPSAFVNAMGYLTEGAERVGARRDLS
jgi:hypothetical protein